MDFESEISRVSGTNWNWLQYYSRTSMAQTQMARLPLLFRTRSWVPQNKSHRCRLGIIWDDYLFVLRNGIICVLIRIA